MKKDQINIGIIGAGMIGKVHSQNLAFLIPQANPLVIADINEKAAVETAALCHIPKVTTHYSEIIEDPDIDAIVIFIHRYPCEDHQVRILPGVPFRPKVASLDRDLFLCPSLDLLSFWKKTAAIELVAATR